MTTTRSPSKTTTTTSYPLVAVREFREKIHTYTEPVIVIHTRGELRVLGTWFPDVKRNG
jgi:hypothetical protein